MDIETTVEDTCYKDFEGSSGNRDVQSEQLYSKYDLTKQNWRSKFMPLVITRR